VNEDRRWKTVPGNKPDKNCHKEGCAYIDTLYVNNGREELDICLSMEKCQKRKGGVMPDVQTKERVG
jgi:hypothetical protein